MSQSDFSPDFSPAPQYPGIGLLRSGGFEAAKRLLFLGFLILIMLIPLSMVQGVVDERSWRKESAISEVSAQWGPDQYIAGPVIVVPVERTTAYQANDGTIGHNKFTYDLVITPETLNISATQGVERRHKSIYDILLYGADVKLTGRFLRPDLASVSAGQDQVKWHAASLVVGLQDASGTRALRKADIEFAGRELELESGTLSQHPFAAGFHANVDLSSFQSAEFEIDLSLAGRSALSFLPLASATDIQVTSNWPHPNFTGTPLPTGREITSDGFSADWKISRLSTGIPSFARKEDFKLNLANASYLGVAITEPGDAHQQTDRIVKYGILVIGLTFATIFVAGLLKRDRVHLVQYVLIGSALCLFYLLLLSLAEQFSFGAAYFIASAADISLVAWYAARTIRVTLGLIVGLVLALVHAYLYVLLQMESYALLSGTLGLFLALAVVMYVTRNVDWFAIGNEPAAKPTPAEG